MPKVAVVTGSNKGIGFGIVKGLCQRFDGVVYLTSRNIDLGRKAVAELNKLNLHPEYHQLDVSDRASVKAFSEYINRKYGGLDILVNNAGIGERVDVPSSYEESKTIIDTNFRSILTMEEYIYPLVRTNGRILNISSNCGHLSNIRNSYWRERLSKQDLRLDDVNQFVDWFLESKRTGTFNPEDIADTKIEAYRVSKVAMSAVTILQSKKYKDKNISINSMHPAVVSTDMSFGRGMSIEEASKTPLNLLLDAPQTLNGAYVWFDGTIYDWCDFNADLYFKMSCLSKENCNE